jgi:hypothetical protein
MDQEIGRAIKIGENNKEVIELLTNWCAHLRVEKWGGSGMVEEMTGLPIGMRYLACKHQRSDTRAASMHLKHLALEFYDRNCADCSERIAVRLPNITQLVGRRDAERKAAAQASAEVADRLAMAVSARSKQRELWRSSASHTKRGVLDVIESFDQEPSDSNKRTLVEAARAVPNAFTPGARSQLFELVRAGSTRAVGALAALELFAGEDTEVFGAALDVLGEGLDPTASRIVARGPAAPINPNDEPWQTRIRQALPSLIWRSAPHYPVAQDVEEPDRSPLTRLWNIAPQLVTISVRRALRSSDDEVRVAGSHAVYTIFELGDTAGAIALVGDLVSVFDQPEERISAHPARTAAWVLSELLRHDPRTVVERLSEAARIGSAKCRLGVLRVYAAIFNDYDDNGRRQRPGEQPVDATDVETHAFRAILQACAALPKEDDLLREAADALKKNRLVPWVLLRESVDTLIGVAALASTEIWAQPTEPVVDDGVLPMLKALNRSSRQTLLSTVIDGLLDRVVDVAVHDPDSAARVRACSQLLDTLDRLHDASQEEFQAELTERLGALAERPENLQGVLPRIYGLLTHRSQLVRASAARAYAALVRAVGPDDLPELLHETFLVLLLDPYVVVHKAAVRALDQVRLPASFAKDAFWAVENIRKIYATDSDSSFLATVVDVWIRLAKKADLYGTRAKTVVLATIAKLQHYDAERILTWTSNDLQSEPGFAELILDLMANPETFDSHYDDLSEQLARLPSGRLQPLAARLSDVALNRSRIEPWRVIDAFRLFADAGLLDWAERLLDRAVEACGNDRENARRRVSLLGYRDAVRFERALTEARPQVAATIARDGEHEASDNEDRTRLLIDARTAVVEAIVSGSVPAAEELEATAEAVAACRATFSDWPIGSAVDDLSATIRVAAQLSRWTGAYRRAEMDADRYLRAAKQRAIDVAATIAGRAETDTPPEHLTSPLLAALSSVASITSVADAEAAVRLIALLPTAVPAGRRKARKWTPAGWTVAGGERSARTDERMPPIAFLQFHLNGVEFGDPHLVRADVVHDIRVDARLSQWPEGATRVEFLPLHVEPADIMHLPSFAFAKAEHTQEGVPVDLQSSGRFRITAPQDLLARPLGVSYTVVAYAADGTTERLVVQGQQHLAFRSYDLEANPITGFRDLDRRLLELRDDARRRTGLDDEELTRFMTLLAGAGRIAAQSVADNRYRGDWSEDAFHDDVRDRLRLTREIGSSLEEHPHAGGGITDLSFHRVRLELKADDDGDVTVATAIDRYGAQTAQYVVASDRRSGVLMVLDTETKDTNPPLVSSDVALRMVPVEHGDGRGVVLGVVIVRGNLARPSDLSR